MQQPPDEGGVTWKSGDEKVIVMSLRDLVKDPVLLEYIHRCVRSMTILGFKTSRLLLLHLQRLCDKRQADPTMVFPAVNVTMFCHLFYMLQDNFIQKPDAVVEKHTAEERESYAISGGYEGTTFGTGAMSQLLNYMAKQYIANLELHAKQSMDLLTCRLVIASLLKNNKPLPRHLQHAPSPSGRLHGGNNKANRRLKHAHRRKVLEWTRRSGNVSRKEAKKRADDLVAHLRNPKDLCDASDMANYGHNKSKFTTLESRIQFIYSLNKRVEETGGSPVSLVPLFSSRAKHIRIDSVGLYKLLLAQEQHLVDEWCMAGCSFCRGVFEREAQHVVGQQQRQDWWLQRFKRPVPNKQAFQKERDELWRKLFKIPDHLFHGPQRVDVLPGTAYFNSMITTDGVSASIVTFKWRRTYTTTGGDKYARKFKASANTTSRFFAAFGDEITRLNNEDALAAAKLEAAYAAEHGGTVAAQEHEAAAHPGNTVAAESALAPEPAFADSTAARRKADKRRNYRHRRAARKKAALENPPPPAPKVVERTYAAAFASACEDVVATSDAGAPATLTDTGALVAADAAADAMNKAYTAFTEYKFIGVDPGKHDLFSAALFDDPSWTCRFSAKQYHTDSGFKWHAAQMSRLLDKGGLKEWMQETPTSKTTTPEKTIEYLKYLFATDKFRVYMDVHLSMRVRLLRWQTYKQNRSSVEAACDRLTKGFDRQKTVICFGSAKIASTMRGCLPTPRSKLFVDCLERRGWRVIMMSEYNTSQVCSACHWRLPQGVAPVKLCKLGDKYDPFRFKHKPVGQHTILRCTNRECRVIWNRDRNAARNMSYLGMLECLKLDRPWYFQKKLAFPPLAHTLQPPRPSSAATRSTTHTRWSTRTTPAAATAAPVASTEPAQPAPTVFSRRNISCRWAAHERRRTKDRVAAAERRADTERLAELDSDFARAIESLHHRLDVPASP
ncbi:hypothetical protein IWW47_001885, partial [Coemansia sp. RSA 2052]